jgi:urease subunit beta
VIPGEIVRHEEPVTINSGSPAVALTVTNTSTVPIHLTAHFHVFEANPSLRFNRRTAWGMRPDVPADGSVRIEPGRTVTFDIVPIGGARIVRGFSGAVDGSLDSMDRNAALQALVARGYLHSDDDESALVTH